MFHATNEQHADPSGTSLPEFVHIPTNGRKGIQAPCPICQSLQTVLQAIQEASATPPGPDSQTQPSERTQAFLDSREATTRGDASEAGYDPARSSANLFKPSEFIPQIWPPSCLTPLEERLGGTEFEAMDAARTVLSGRMPSMAYRADLRKGDQTRELYLSPGGVESLSNAYNRTGLIGWPADLEHLNAPDVEHPDHDRGRDRADQDWNAVRRLYADAAEEALSNLADFANYGPIRNHRLTARICQAIHDELADLSREFSDTFELEEAFPGQPGPFPPAT